MLYGIQYGWFCYLVEDDTACVLRLEAQHLVQVPTDSFSLAVFIGAVKRPGTQALKKALLVPLKVMRFVD